MSEFDVLLNLFERRMEQIFLPRLHNHTERILQEMSQALEAVLAKLDTTSNQIIDLLNTDQSSLAALQSAVDLQAAQGDDSAEVAKAQAVLDKLAAAVTPPTTAPVPVAPADPAGPVLTPDAPPPAPAAGGAATPTVSPSDATGATDTAAAPGSGA